MAISTAKVQPILDSVVAEDEQTLRILAAQTDWADVDVPTTSHVLTQIGMYGCSGRTDRYRDVVESILNRGGQPDLSTCILLCLNDQAKELLKSVDASIEPLALHEAAERGNTELARLLCENGWDPNHRDSNGSLPVANALHAGPWKTEPALDVVAVLRSNGASIDYWTMAALGDSDSLDRFLHARPDAVDSLNEAGQSALFVAARNNHPRAVNVLLDHGANPNRSNTDGQTPLSTACLHMLSQECDIQIVNALVEQGAARTIESAVVTENLEEIEEYMRRSPSVLDGQAHESPLGYAIHTWRINSLRCLLRLGARPSEENWNHIRRIANDEELVHSLQRESK